MRSISWKGMRLLAEDRVLAASVRRNGVRIPTPGHEAAVSLMGYLFHQNQVKPDYRERIQQLGAQDQAGFAACLAPVWGGALAQELAAHAVAGEWAWFATWVKHGKRHLLLNMGRHPVDLLRIIGGTVFTPTHRMIFPVGLWVAFMGPDGAGKTTVAEAYRARLSTLFDPPHQRQFHWRPRWLPAPGRLAGQGEAEIIVEDPHGKPPRGSLVSRLRFGYFWLDFLLGHWFKVRPLLVRRYLISFDRCYFDFLVDPRRFRLKLPQWVMRFFSHLLPQPDLIFVFDAPAEVLHARKQELGLAEIETQLDTLRALAGRNARMHTVRVDRDVQAIVDELERLTLDYLDRRARRRLGWAQAKYRSMGTPQ